MSAGNEFQPPPQAVLAEESPYGMTTELPVNVKVLGPVRTQTLPHKASSTLTKTVTTVPVRLLQADHRRARTQLMSVGQNMLVAFSNASSQDPGHMALWPANVPLVLEGDSEVWAAAATATTSISIIVETWATGETGIS